MEIKLIFTLVEFSKIIQNELNDFCVL